MKITVTTLFGLESLVREDLTAIGYDREQITVSDGVVTLDVSDGNWSLDVARANMWVRRGERIFFEVGSFFADSFEQFFDETQKLPWNDFIPQGYEFIVNGFSRKSKLFGISALQSLSKKAIVKSLCTARGIGDNGIISEDRNKGTVRIQFGIVNDNVRMMIDTSGDGLHKRGYRPLTHEAPIRETLASGMVSLSRYRPFGYEALVDPFCGSGTILIEAALMAADVAPGKNRHFSYEALPYIGSKARETALEEALDKEDLTPPDDIFYFGSDIDPKAVSNAKINAKAAGVDAFIKFAVADAETRTPSALAKITGMDRQLVLTNPPYGGRLMTPEEADEIYKMISRTYLTNKGTCQKGIRLSVISPDDSFERAIGHKADKRTKLYNGNIKCQLNNFYKL
ncbi:putative N6-adenine-specific DNA methylase [Ruminococcaceae bacterium KH2T8]|nr:putative N6-adenine-specific DNA methylase [Ruminococcaceae bacterium KH2T8]